MMGTIRFVLVLLGSLVVAGLGAIYVWSTLNQVLEGGATWARGLSALAVVVGMLGLLLWLLRYFSHLEQPK